MNNPSYKLGFIGVGLMGRPMILRLLEAGYPVTAWNRSRDKLKAVTAAGAQACDTVSDLVRTSQIILLCLADTAVVSAIVEQGILRYGSPEKLVIDLSSIDPSVTRQLADQLYRHCGMRWVDAPVSGGTIGAKQGTLAIMAGGNEADIAIARDVLRPLYQQLTHMGEVGCGQISKICNQMLVSCNVLVMAEMMALARQAGVAVDKIPQALAGGFADSKPLQIVGPEMAANHVESIKWRVQTLLKDMNMAVDLANRLGNATPMSGLAAQLLQLHGSRGFLDQDPATLIKLYEPE